MRSLSLSEARRLAIAAQGLDKPPDPRRPITPARIARTIRRLGIVQIDSVNVLARAHHLVLAARLASRHDEGLSRLVPDALDQASNTKPRSAEGRRLFEYWAHEASFLPVEDHCLWRWRMADARAGIGIYSRLARFGEERRDLIDRTLREIEQRGPVTANMLDGAERGTGGWWGWSNAKHTLEWLFWVGLVTARQRQSNFERIYDLTERALPRAVLDVPTPSREEAQRQLVLQALKAHGVATIKDLADHPRIRTVEAASAIQTLEEEGRAVPVRVPDWPEAWMDAKAVVPRKVEAAALLCPFDPLIWTRPRAERLFGMRIKLEIYTPEAERVHGYYVLPFLWGDRLVARVDLKSDRKNKRLVVRAAHAAGNSAGSDEIVARLAQQLRSMARSLDFADIVVEPRGDLATALQQSVPEGS